MIYLRVPFVLDSMGNIKAKKGNVGHPIRETRSKYNEKCSSYTRDGNRNALGEGEFFCPICDNLGQVGFELEFGE